MDAILAGLGFGLSFWMVLIPIGLILTRNPEKESFNEKLIEYWDKNHETAIQQLKAIEDLSIRVAGVSDDIRRGQS